MSNENIDIKVLESPEWEVLPYTYLTPKELYEIHISETVETLRVDNIVIVCGAKKAYLAKVCYGQYKYRHKLNKVVVQKNSFIKERLSIAKSIVDFVVKQHENLCKPVSIHPKILVVTNFLNISMFKSTPNDIELTRHYLKPFIANLLEQVRIYTPKNKETGQALVGFSSTTAYRKQAPVIDFLCLHMNINSPELTQGIKLVKKGEPTTKTQPISEDELAQEFNYYTIMFRELSTVVLNNEMLPKKITFIESSHWLLPTIDFLSLKKSSNRCKILPYWNHEDGTQYTKYALEELTGEKLTSHYWHCRCSTIQESFISQNSEWSMTKQNMAVAALKAYYMQFSILTGMNDSVVAATPFNADYEITKEAQNFKGIKYRANGKEVHFSIQSEFIADFKLFMKLREFVLEKIGVSNFEYLFFSISKKRDSVASLYLDGGWSGYVRNSLSKKSTFKLNTSRKLRVTKGLWVRKRFGEVVSAYVLQHKISTSMTSYSGNNAIDTSEEFTNYFEWLNEQILTQDFSVKTETGACTSGNEPAFAEGTPDEFQKCGKGEGCLFCSNFRLHKDETDLRKLFSLKFLVNECVTVAANNEHFEGIYRPLLNRIDSLVAELIKQEPDLKVMVDSVETSVFEYEELTPYWLRKYQTLIEIGVL